MKIKLDENLPVALVAVLASAGHDADTVPQEGLTGHDDSDIWRAAQESGRFLVTQDLDFSDTRHYVPGTHHGLLLIRLGEPSRRHLTERLTQIITTEKIETWQGCFVVASDRKIRVTRPKPEFPSPRS